VNLEKVVIVYSLYILVLVKVLSQYFVSKLTRSIPGTMTWYLNYNLQWIKLS